MGLLDDLTKGGNLGSLADLVTQNPEILNAAKSLLDPKDGTVGGASGLEDLVGKLSSSGLGDQVASWLSSGANQSVSTEQLTAALDNDTLRQFADKAGIDAGQAGAALAKVLPGLIDQLSPGGNAPSGDALSSLLGKLG
jgi:uncharacterized protein YidB (DUF937 family)